MADEGALHRLADLLGIEPFYWDIWGNRRDIPAGTKRDLAAAMGFDSDDDAGLQRSLSRIAARDWDRLVPPCRVLDQDWPVSVPLVLPPGSELPVTWVLHEEGGTVHDGGVLPRTLPVEGEGQDRDAAPRRRHRLDLPRLPTGYHDLTVSVPGGPPCHCRLIIAPSRCLHPDAIGQGRRLWGLAVQLYGLQSANSWGLGDFTGLGTLAEAAAGLGADAIGLNPLHALFPADAGSYSPYSPSSRGFLNILHIDVAGLPDLDEDQELRARIAEPGFQEALARARAAELVDYPAVSALKLPVLAALHDGFRRRHLGPEASLRGLDFRRFQAEGGIALHRQAVFEALHARFLGEGGPWSWRDWPAEFRHPESPAVLAWAEAEAVQVEFYAWLQWLADTQLAEAAARARRAGMAIGFYRDLAVAENPVGANAWAFPDVVVAGANVGAPGDMFNPGGQNWGLAPLSPIALADRAYAPFITALRANMRHAGALRIDHVMALQHLFWIPSRPGHAGGAYVRYPLDDLLRIIALESHRNRCLVIGEDLGTVPEGFRPALQRAGILSYKVLWFERDWSNHSFLPPEAYPAEALVAVSTHDLPTLAGFWSAHDQDWRLRLGLFPNAEIERSDREDRQRDRHRLLDLLRRCGLAPAGSESGPDGIDPDDLAAAIHTLVARTAGRLLMVQAEDVFGEIEQVNLPGTVTEHPNWRRRRPVAAEDFAADARVQRLAAAIRAGR